MEAPAGRTDESPAARGKHVVETDAAGRQAQSPSKSGSVASGQFSKTQLGPSPPVGKLTQPM